MQDEVIDSKELANRWNIPETWVRESVRNRSSDPIPHLKLGRYVRFEWGSPDLEGWWERHRICNGKKGGESRKEKKL